MRENRAGMYSALSYYLSKVLVELPFQILFPTAMAGIIVKPISHEGRFIFYAVFMTLLNNVGQVRNKKAFGFFATLLFLEVIMVESNWFRKTTGFGDVDWLHFQEQGGSDAGYATGNFANHDFWRTVRES